LVQKTPIVSIPKDDFETQRPEVSLLLELAGISSSNLLFADDPVVGTFAANVTLVDHNVLAERFQEQSWKVLEIMDHHEDEGLYLDSCSVRNIAFANNNALVASACTLVAERLKELWDPPYPAPLGVLLLGVILLDSVDLSREVGKVTQRDRHAVDDLLENSDWQGLTRKSRNALGITSTPWPNTTNFFTVLQDAKYDVRFWQSLSVGDALRLDYKEYPCEKGTFGISTVLMPLQDFLSKTNVIEGIIQYMEQMRVEFLGIMFAFEDGDHFFRQLALCATFQLDRIVDFLLDFDSEDSLDLKAIDTGSVDIPGGNPDLTIRFFAQQNVKPSRKQIGPILTTACHQKGSNRLARVQPGALPTVPPLVPLDVR
jgi:exopolyphosphatase